MSFNATGTATANVDYKLNAQSFSNGVTYDANTGKITVPAGVTSFSVTVQTLADNVVGEPLETVKLDIGGQSATGGLPQANVAPKEDEKRAGDYVIATMNGRTFSLHHGDVVIAAITSCTNTSNPDVMIAAGLLAKKANARGLKSRPWVKTSLAPGSTVVTEYFNKAGLTEHLDAIGFNTVGYGCTTCIGNSGPIPEPISATINEHDLVAAAVLSGNRNFEGRIHPDVKANYLASPPLVVAYALAGTVDIDFATEPIGTRLQA